jgi:phosphoribosylformylglycinamidine synthase I
MTPRVLIFSGYGLNCEEETKTAFDIAGAKSDIVHIEDVAKAPSMLSQYQIAVFPGGFSYGDDTGSGKAYGARVRHHLGRELEKFLERDTLMAGICNGFQILTASGILPGALIANDSARFTCRWVDLEVKGESPWLAGLTTLSLPIAHGEGKYVDTEANLDVLEKNGNVALTYSKGEMTAYQGLPYNPNGASRDIAGITARNGRVLGLMPHPERGAFFEQRPDWTVLREEYERAGKKLPVHAVGIEIFRNAVKYFA